MSNEIQVFTNEKFGSVRTTVIDGKPWFVARDVAVALGYTNPRKAIGDHVDPSDKGVTKCDTLGGAQKMVVINESGLYSLVLSSKLPAAKQFKRWITCDVIPAIRQHGAYISDEVLLRILADPAQAHMLVMEYIQELEQHGYLVRRQGRKPDGKMGGVEYCENVDKPHEARLSGAEQAFCLGVTPCFLLQGTGDFQENYCTVIPNVLYYL